MREGSDQDEGSVMQKGLVLMYEVVSAQKRLHRDHALVWERASFVGSELGE
jgi:hypothetical protein